MANVGMPYELVALVGADGAGKTTLWRAMEEAARSWNPGASVRPIRTPTGSANVLDVPTGTAVHEIVDFDGAASEHALLPTARHRGVVLVVSATDAVVPGTRDSLERVRHLGIPVLAVALTRCDLVEDAELLDLVTMEIREFLGRYGAPGDSLPVVPTPTLRRQERAQRMPELVGASALLRVLGAS